MRKFLAVTVLLILATALALTGCLPAPEGYALPSSGAIGETAQALQSIANNLATQEAARYAGTSTTQAHEYFQATATAAQSTAIAAAAESTQSAAYTATAVEMINRQTATALSATAVADNEKAKQQAIINAYEVQQMEREAERQRLTNTALALAPYAIGVIAFGVLLYASVLVGVKYWKRPIVIDRDARGDAPILVGNYGDIIDQDRVPVGVIRQLKAGVVAQPVASESFQERTTALDQHVDHDTRGSLEAPASQPRIQGRTSTQQPAQLSPYPDIQVRRIEPGDLPHKLVQRPDIALQLEDDWKKENVVTVPYRDNELAQKEDKF